MNQNNLSKDSKQAFVFDFENSSPISNASYNNSLCVIYFTPPDEICYTTIKNTDIDSITEAILHAGEIFNQGSSVNNVNPDNLNTLLSYGWWDFLTAVILFVFYVIDIILDISLTVSLYRLYESKDWFIISVVILLISNFFASFVSFVLYLFCVRRDCMKVSRLRWFLISCSHFLLLGALYRFLRCIKYGWKFLHTMVEDEKKSYILKALFEDEVLSCLSIFELFLETLPQLSLQLYIMILHYKVEEESILSHIKIDRETLAIWQAARVIIAIASVSFSLVFISQSYKRTCGNAKGYNKKSILILFIGNLFIIAPRIFAFVLFSSIYGAYLLIASFLHWFIMFVSYAKDNEFRKRISKIPCLFIPFVVIILLFCHLFHISQSAFGMKRYFYHFVMYFENIVLIVLWYIAIHHDPWYHIGALELVVIGFWVGFACLWLQNYFFLPHQKTEIPRHNISTRFIPQLNMETSV